MMIEFTCTCGKSLHAPEGSEGRKARCPRCGSIVTVPDGGGLGTTADHHMQTSAPAMPPPPMPAAAPARAPASRYAAPADPLLSPRYAAPHHTSLRRFTYLLLLLALIPLVLSTFFPRESHGEELLEAIAKHPEIIARAENSDMSVDQLKTELFNTLPNHHVTGALLAYDSHAQWLMALAAAAAYFTFLLLVFPKASRYSKGLLFAGLFTGTAGIILLLAFQWAAFHMPLIIPRGIIGLVLLVVKLIGWSYSLADDPDSNFFLSFLGYTCGVGLCEEIAKAIPMLWRIKTAPGDEDASWNSLMLWGLASGIGFGIAEGIMYSGRYYNGLAGADMYYTRFISCVVLHAMWAGAVGISIYRRQGDLINADNNWSYFLNVVLIIIVPMVLHGLYDTLLTKDHDVWALVVALATFVWLAYQIERQQRAEPVGGGGESAPSRQGDPFLISSGALPRS